MEKLKTLLVKRAIRIDNNVETYRVIFHRGLIAAFIYSILYGIYEYFIVYNYVRLLNFFGTPVINWIIMYTGVCVTVAFATRYDKKFNIESVIMGLMLMVMLEDVIFWLCLWLDKGVYPFPAGNWWDSMIASFRVLGGLGQPIPFWPYTPFYYIPGFSMVIGYYFCCTRGPKTSRIYAWIVGPFFIAIIAGALSTDFFALICLLIIPSSSYLYLFIIIFLNRKNGKIN